METITAELTGLFFKKQSWESLLHTVLSFKEKQWDGNVIRENSIKYSTDNFKKSIKEFVEHRYEENKKNHFQTQLLTH
jgi:hypothetical protein